MALNHTTPSAAPAPSGPHAPLYQRIVEDVVAGARPLMERIAEATRMSLQQRLDQARTPGEHHAMLEARQQLTRLNGVMSERYPEALRKALEQQSGHKEEKATRSLFSVHFDELELMDENQISDSVERARARQVLASAVEGPLADLDALVCAALGQPQVRPEHNPLRPDAFLQALQAVVSQMQVTEQVRHDWMGQMAQALGKELRALYVAQTERLKQSGVQPVGYAMRQANGQYVYVAPTEGGASPGFGFESGPAHDVGPIDPIDRIDHPAPATADPLLTLGRLRRLLLGELDEPAAPAQAPAAPETFAERFTREFEHPDPLPHIDPPATDFAMTVPAAFEALQEMNQVGQMMERLGSQRAQPGDGWRVTLTDGRTSEQDLVIAAIGLPCVVKPVMSSSGKGQSTVRFDADIDAAWDYAQTGGRAGAGRVIVEGFIDFDYEITLLTVRHAAGTSFCEPIGHLQRDGDYRESWQPQPMSPLALFHHQGANPFLNTFRKTVLAVPKIHSSS